MIALLLAAVLAGAPEEPLVDASKVVPGLVVELRYATENNFLHQRIYPEGAKCFLRQSVAERLAKAARALAADGFRLKVWDCYRPTSAQEQMWKIYPHPGFVANPKVGSNHSRGTAVDLTLVQKDGSPVTMPTDFDSFTSEAHIGAHVSAEADANRRTLTRAMNAAGFHTILKEWWHYNAPHAGDYAIADAPLR